MFDLNRIIAKKSYRVTMPPEAVFEEIEKYLCPIEISEGCKEWSCILRRGVRSRTFTLDLGYKFITQYMKIDSTKEERRELHKKFFENLDNNIDIIYSSLRNNIIDELKIIVSDINELGCTCQVECTPILYTKISKQILSMEDVSEFQIQDAHREGLSFLDEVFIGGLEAKPIKEAHMISHRLEILVNNTNNREITERIDSLLDDATGEVLICGWIGTHFIPKLKEIKSKGVNIRFITHKPKEAKTQPWKSEIEEAYGELCTDIGLESICIDPSMHGRMVIVDNKALIGSMDLSSYSLTGTHTEFAIYTEEPEIVRRLRRQFNAKFEPLKTN